VEVFVIDRPLSPTATVVHAWQRRGNIHRVANRPDRPRNPAAADNLDTMDTTSAALARLRALWGGFPVGVPVSLRALVLRAGGRNW
jgi:hypothetical protein